MKVFITILLFLICNAGYSQQTGKISVVPKSKLVRYGRKHANFKWDEVVLNNKLAEKKINITIRKALAGYQQFEDWDDYEPDCNVIYAKNDLVSYFLTEYHISENMPHGFRTFGTLNFDTKTGKWINFNQFIIAGKLAALDTLIKQRLIKELGGFEIDPVVWFSQLSDPEYLIKDKGVTLLFRGDTYALTMIEIIFSYHEIEPFVNKNGLLKAMYP